VSIHAQGDGNVFFVASDQPQLKLRHPPDLLTVHPGCREEVRAKLAGIMETQPDNGIVLTDDYNPADYYDAANRATVRRSLTSRMKGP